MAGILDQLQGALYGASPSASSGRPLSSRVTPRSTPRELQLSAPAEAEPGPAAAPEELGPLAAVDEGAEAPPDRRFLLHGGDGASEHGAGEGGPSSGWRALQAKRGQWEASSSDALEPGRRRSSWDGLLEPGVLRAAAEASREEEDEGLEPQPLGVFGALNRRLTVQRVVSRLHEIRVSVNVNKQDGTQVVHSFNGEDTTGTEYDIPEDSYGAAILAIVKDMQEVIEGYGGVLSLVRCAFALVLLVVNLVLQACILLFIGTHVVQPAVHHIQADYRDYHTEVFTTDGKFQPELWSRYQGKDELCQIGMTSRFFYCVLLFVWVTSMLTEFRAGTRLLMQVFWMPVCRVGADMLRIDGSGTICIVALTQRTRVLLWVVVVLPKLVISVLLLVLGCKWLSATTSFEALVMNTMAMEFVLHIDELLYEAFVPVAYRRQVADINFFRQHPRKDEREMELEEFCSYGKSMSYLVIGVAIVLLWSNCLQSVLPRDISDVKKHCRAYLETQSPICGRWGILKFGSSNTDSCYPFGGDSDLQSPGGAAAHHPDPEFHSSFHRGVIDR